jgi:D-3-phosphoglycerate dehydrogenase / 2-oxoglutarate reductase
MPKHWVVSLMDNIAQEGLVKLRASSRFKIEQEAADPNAIIVRSRKMTEASLDLPHLSCIGRAGAGVDNIPVPAATKRGIPVFNAPGGNANAVKEAVIGSIIALSRNLLPASISLRENGAVDRARFEGREIQGRTLGIIGLGQIGGRVAEAALALGMDVIGYDKYLSVPMALRLPTQMKVREDMDAVLRGADILTLHVALTEETRNMVNATTLARMKPGAMVVNFARADVVDAAAMRAALDGGKLSGYATDFPKDEYKGCDKVLMTPHIGASTKEAQINCAEMVAESIIGFLAEGEVRNSANFPTVALQRSEGAHRVIFANDNVPGMISKVSALLAGKGINIMSMTNASNSQIGYSIVDCTPAPNAALLQQMKAIPGVLMVRAVDEG